MNNYNYDDYISDNYTNGLNNMINNNFDSTFMMPSYKLTNTYNGFIRGNMFDNLYEGYKNYTPTAPTSNSQRETLLNKILEYNFALTDLGLYLDLNPNNTSIVNLYNQYLQEEKKLCVQYERNYGPLTTESMYLNQNNWVWNNSPWPWEVK